MHNSISPKFNIDTTFSGGDGGGRSGSFFFFSHDRKFILKTMSEDELKLYVKILPEFNVHF